MMYSGLIENELGTIVFNSISRKQKKELSEKINDMFDDIYFNMIEMGIEPSEDDMKDITQNSAHFICTNFLRCLLKGA